MVDDTSVAGLGGSRFAGHLWDKLNLIVLWFLVDNHENISQSLPALVSQQTEVMIKSPDSSTTMRDLHDSFLHGTTAPSGPGPQHCRNFTTTLTRTILCRMPLDEWSARRRDLYLTTHNTHKKQTFMPRLGFEPTIPASERPQTHALEGTGTRIGPVR